MIQLNVTEIDLPRLSSNHEIGARLSGVQYWIRFWLSERPGWSSWTMDFLDPSKDPIAQGIRLVPLHSLLYGVTDARRPPGVLMLVDAAKSGNEIGPDDLGNNYRLVYVTPAV